MINRRKFNENDLRRVNRAEDFRDPREPPIGIGDIVRLNSGSERMLVVDFDGEGRLTTAWRNTDGTVEELEIAEPCVHRAPVLED